VSDERKNIDNLFSEGLEDHSEESLEISSHWNGIEFKVQKSNFLKFHLTKFNIYYAGFILINILLTIFLFVRMHEIENTLSSENLTSRQQESVVSPLTNQEPQNITNNNQLSADSNTQTNLLPGENSKNIVVTKTDRIIIKKDNKGNNKINTSSLMADTTTTLITNKKSPEEKIPAITKNDTIGNSIAVVKVKPPVIIRRVRDTIRKVDTLYTKKRKQAK
jgi:hypothetical protein